MRGELLAERFRIGGRLGAGGMGEVWAATDERMRRDVAVKLVHVFGAHEAETRARFRREVQLAGRLSHQNIVTVHDWGETRIGGRPVFYLVMELVRGVPLGKRLRELKQEPSASSWPLAVGWGVQIAQALDAAHRRGVVHRDIKPSNVLLTPEGTAKVLDFGVAKFIGETMSVHELTVTGALLGSPPYMSPEQAEGAREIDHRSDLYSLGCLLYHALTGRPPFVSDSPLAVLRMHLDETPVPPEGLVEVLPESLNDLVLGLLAKDAADRPAHAAAVRDALSTVLVEGCLGIDGGAVLEASQLENADSVAGRFLAGAREMLLGRAEEVSAARRAEADAQVDAQLRAALALTERAKAEAERIVMEARREASREGEQAARDIGAIRKEADRARAEADRALGYATRLRAAADEEVAEARATAESEARAVMEKAEAEAARIRDEARRGTRRTGGRSAQADRSDTVRPTRMRKAAIYLGLIPDYDELDYDDLFEPEPEPVREPEPAADRPRWLRPLPKTGA